MREEAFTEWTNDREKLLSGADDANNQDSGIHHATQTRMNRIPVGISNGKVELAHTSARESAISDAMDTPAFLKTTEEVATVKVLPLEHGWGGIRGPPTNAKQASMACMEGFTSTVNPNPTPNQVTYPPPEGTRYALLSTPHHEMRSDTWQESDKDVEPEHIGHLLAEIEGPVLGFRSEEDHAKAVEHLYAPGSAEVQYTRVELELRTQHYDQ